MYHGMRSLNGYRYLLKQVACLVGSSSRCICVRPVVRTPRLHCRRLKTSILPRARSVACWRLKPIWTSCVSLFHWLLIPLQMKRQSVVNLRRYRERLHPMPGLFLLDRRDETCTVGSLSVHTQKSSWLLDCLYTGSSDCSPNDVVEQRMSLLGYGVLAASQAMKSSCADVLATDAGAGVNATTGSAVSRNLSGRMTIWSESMITAEVRKAEGVSMHALLTPSQPIKTSRGACVE